MKPLRKLILKSLKLNKIRTLMTIICIMLSVALITVTVGSVSSFQYTEIHQQELEGNYELKVLGGVTKENYKKIQGTRNVNQVHIVDPVGVAYIPEGNKFSVPYLYIRQMNDKAFTDCFNMPLAKGRYPKNSSEIVVSEDMIKFSDADLKIGDTVTLESGNRVSIQDDYLPPEYYLSYTYDKNNKRVCQEKINVKDERTYKIVGITGDEISSEISLSSDSACCNAYTGVDIDNISESAQMYVDYTQQGEKEYVNTTASILGITTEQFLDYNDMEIDLSWKEYEKIEKDMKFIEYEINEELLWYKGYDIIGIEKISKTVSTPSVLLPVSGRDISTLGLFLVIIIIAVSVFLLHNGFSVSAKEKTAFYGMIVSVGATSRQIRKAIVFESLIMGMVAVPLGTLTGLSAVALIITDGVSLIYNVPITAVVMILFISVLIIFFSGLLGAVRVSRISPVVAIRGNRDIKQKKRYRTPKYIKKLFGTSGAMAHKNLKRNKKNYHGTVIAIRLCVVLILVSTAVLSAADSILNIVAESFDYDIDVKYTMNLDWEKSDKCFQEIKALPYVKEARTMSFVSDSQLFSTGIASEDISVLAVDDQLYKKALKEMGFDYDQVKDKAIYKNTCTDVYGFPYQQNADGSLKEGDALENINGIKKEIEIAAVTEGFPPYLSSSSSQTLLVSEEWMRENVAEKKIGRELLIKTDAPKTLYKNIKQLGYGELIIDIWGYSLRQDMELLVYEIKAALFGFLGTIIVITLCNVFIVISSSMKIRQKEFAILKSIGMTKQQFHKMLREESILYCLKSLIIGVPVGLLLSGLVYLIYPFNCTVLCIILVVTIIVLFVSVWLTVKYGFSKTENYNIIETIRNDNI